MYICVYMCGMCMNGMCLCVHRGWCFCINAHASGGCAVLVVVCLVECDVCGVCMHVPCMCDVCVSAHT